MTATLAFHTLDVFTATPFSGNPLAVVSGADALSPAQMLTLAREFNLSETIFVQSPADPAHTARVRIFFPTAEIPFAGHPTLGCAILLALQIHGEEADFETLITLEEEAGLVPVQVSRKAGQISGEFTAPVLPIPARPAPSGAQIAAALDLPEDRIGPHRPGVFQGGPAFLYVPVTDLASLGQARVIEPFWSAVMTEAGVDSAFLYTADGEGAFRSRMFSPGGGIPEDPATGSATAILAAQLLAHDALDEGTNAFHLRQGVEMGRPSDLFLSVDLSGGAIAAVRIRGTAVPVSEGRIRVP